MRFWSLRRRERGERGTPLYPPSVPRSPPLPARGLIMRKGFTHELSIVLHEVWIVRSTSPTFSSGPFATCCPGKHEKKRKWASDDFNNKSWSEALCWKEENAVELISSTMDWTETLRRWSFRFFTCCMIGWWNDRSDRKYGSIGYV